MSYRQSTVGMKRGKPRKYSIAQLLRLFRWHRRKKVGSHHE